MHKSKKHIPVDVKEVSKKFPPSTRLLCPKNGKTYQMGVREGCSKYFWMLCEDDQQKAKLDASVILATFQRLEVPA